jgi:hypothetical protein
VQPLTCVVPVIGIICVRQAERWSAPGHGLLGRLRLVKAFVPAPLSGARVSIAIWLVLGRKLRLWLAARLGALYHQNPVIVFGMLEVILLHHAVTGRAGITGELKIFLVHVRGGTADLHVRPCRIEGPVVSVVMIVLRPATASP